MLGACANVSEKRSSNITEDVGFIYAPVDTSCGELWIIHEKNKITTDAANKRFQQIRSGARW